MRIVGAALAVLVLIPNPFLLKGAVESEGVKDCFDLCAGVMMSSLYGWLAMGVLLVVAVWRFRALPFAAAGLAVVAVLVGIAMLLGATPFLFASPAGLVVVYVGLLGGALGGIALDALGSSRSPSASKP